MLFSSYEDLAFLSDVAMLSVKGKDMQEKTGYLSFKSAKLRSI